MQTKKGSATIIVFTILLLALGGTVWHFKNLPMASVPMEQPQAVKTKEATINKPQLIEESRGTTTQTEILDSRMSWKTYRDEQYGFSFDYPSDFNLKIEQPASKYGENYPQKIIQIIPSYESSYNIKLTIKAGTPKKGDSTICLNKETTLGKQQKTVTEVSCGDAGFSNRTYTLSLNDKVVLEISRAVQGEDEPATENDLQTILNSFEFSK